MSFDSLAAEGLTSDRFLILRPRYTLNDSTVTGLMIRVNGNTTADYYMIEDGVYLVNVGDYPDLEVTVTFVYYYTTGERSGSASRSATYLVPGTDDVPLLMDDVIYGSDFTLYPDIRIDTNGFEISGATLTAGSGSYVLAEDSLSSTSDTRVFTYPDGIDLTGLIGDMSAVDMSVYNDVPLTLTVNYKDASDDIHSAGYTLRGMYSPGIGAYTEYDPVSKSITVRTEGLSSGTLFFRTEFFISDSAESRGTYCVTIEDPVFTDDGGQLVFTYAPADIETYYNKYVHAVVTVMTYDNYMRFVMGPVYVTE